MRPAFGRGADDAYNCDAGGQLNFGQQQQAFYWCGLAFGEGLALMPLIDRRGSKYLTKVKLLPPSRIVNKTDGHSLVQGVRVDGWGMPLAYLLYQRGPGGYLDEREIAARDRDGRPNLVHRYMPAVGVTRGIGDLGTGMKAYRQFDQYSDANLTKKMIQTIFAATIKTNLQGLAAFEGLMTEGDQVSPGALDLGRFGEAKADWYEGSKIDLSQHGRIAQLFPNDELDFVESRAAGDDFDPIARWLWLEIAAAAGVSYESATGDYRGATYSSVRMAGAKEWLNVLRKRDAMVVPFCQTAAEAHLEEEIGSGRIEIPGGLAAFYEHRSQIARCTWTGPQQPQADDFKTARAHEVLLSMGATTLDTVYSSYGKDWDTEMRQQAAENKLADKLGLPLPHAPKTMLETEEGQDLELEAPSQGGQGERRDPKAPKRRTPGERKSSREGAAELMAIDYGLIFNADPFDPCATLAPVCGRRTCASGWSRGRKR